MAEERLKQKLDQFEKAKEWADLVSILTQINSELSNIDIWAFNSKDVLAKRLSQSLSHTLPPSLHNLVLDTYSVIFTKLNTQINGKRTPWGKYLGLLSPGLFTFYQFAKLEPKIKFLKIIKSQYIKMGRELIYTLCALVNCLSIGLDDQNPEVVKLTEDIFNELEKKVGTRGLIGAIWQTILNTSKVRIASLKYIMKFIPCENVEKIAYATKIPLMASYDPTSKISPSKENFLAEYQELTTEEIKINAYDLITKYYYPSKPTLICNALISCLNDEQLFVKRGALDFIISHLKFGGKILANDEKIQLGIAMCNILNNGGDSIVRRVYQWLFDEVINYDLYSQILNGLLLFSFSRNIKDEQLNELKICHKIIEENSEKVPDLFQICCVNLLKYVRFNQPKTSVEILKKLLKNSERAIILWKLLVIELSNIKSYQFSEIAELSVILFNCTEPVLHEKNTEMLYPILSELLKNIHLIGDDQNTLPVLKFVQLLVINTFKNKPIFTKIQEESGKHFISKYYENNLISRILNFSSDLSNSEPDILRTFQNLFTISTNITSKLNPEITLNLLISECAEKITEPKLYDLILDSFYDSLRLVTEIDKTGLFKKRLANSLWRMMQNSKISGKLLETIMIAEKNIKDEFSEVIKNAILSRENSVKTLQILSNVNELFHKAFPEYTFLNNGTEIRLILKNLLLPNTSNKMIKYCSKIFIESVNNYDVILKSIFLSILEKDYKTQDIIECLQIFTKVLRIDKIRIQKYCKKLEIHENLSHIDASPLRKAQNGKIEPITYFKFLLVILSKHMKFDLNLHSDFEYDLSIICCKLLQDILFVINHPDEYEEFVRVVLEQLLDCWNYYSFNKQGELEVYILEIIKILQMKRVESDIFAITQRKIFTYPLFLNIIKTGLSNEILYIKQAYIQYVIQLLPIIIEYVKSESSNIIQEIVFCIASQLDNPNQSLSMILKMLGAIKDIMHYVLFTEKTEQIIENYLGFLKIILWNYTKLWTLTQDSQIEDIILSTLSKIQEQFPNEFINELYECWIFTYKNKQNSWKLPKTLKIPITLLFKNMQNLFQKKESDVFACSAICHFLYEYLLSQQGTFSNDNIAQIWEEWLQFANQMYNISAKISPILSCWLLDLSRLIIIKTVDINELQKNERKIRHGIKDFFSELPIFIGKSAIDSKSKLIIFNALGNTSKETEIILNKSVKNQEKINQSQICILALNENILEILNKIYGEYSKTKIYEVILNIINLLLPATISPEIENSQQIIELICSFIKTDEEFSYYKKSIYDFFLSLKFYENASPENLHNWRNLLQTCSNFDKSHELFKSLLTDISASDLSLRYYSLKRLSLLILSAKKDHFNDVNQNLLISLMLGLRDAAYSEFVIEYLTLLRTMLLKFSILTDPLKDSAKNLQTLWPHINYKLCQMTEDWTDPDIIKEGLKLLETFHSLDIEDHKLIQWIYVLDSMIFYIIASPKIAFGVEIIERESIPEEFQEIHSDKQEFIPFSLKSNISKFSLALMQESVFPLSHAESSIFLSSMKSTIPEPDSDIMPLLFKSTSYDANYLTEQIMRYIMKLSQANQKILVKNELKIENQLEHDLLSKHK